MKKKDKGDEMKKKKQKTMKKTTHLLNDVIRLNVVLLQNPDSV